MPSENPDDSLLLIRCPSCGQRFKVGEDLRNRTVECGGCEHRFRINDDVIVRGKKFYPGERKNPTLNRFQRVPLAIAPGTTAVPTTRYAEAPDPAQFEPVAPQRVVAGIIGVGGMVFMALLLMFGATRGGILDGMITENRLLMAGFTGLLGMTLLIYANPRGRVKAGFYALLLTAGLVSLPFFFTTGSVPLSGPAVGGGDDFDELTAGPLADPEAAPADPNEDLRNLIGTRPLEEEIERLAAARSTRRAVGVWLRDLRESNRFLVKEYILRTTEADPQSHYYPRGDGDFLMVVTGIEQTLEEVAEIVSKLGTLEKIHKGVSVVEVRVNNDSFVEGAIEKLNNRNDPAFYDLNKRELESIDLDRVSKAVKRLAEAEPRVYRSDINRKLIALLEAGWVDFKADVCRALMVWSETPGEAGAIALTEARKLLEKGRPIPREMVQLFLKEKTPGMVPVLDALWSESPTLWENLYGEAGPAAEPMLLERLGSSEGSLRHSVVRLLGRVGGDGSLPALQAALEGADPELRVLIGNATEAIRIRSGG